MHSDWRARRLLATCEAPRRKRRRVRPRRRRRRPYAPRGTRRGGHSIRAPRARLLWPPRRLPSLPLALCFPHRPDADPPVFAGWTALRPRDGLVEVRNIYKEVAGELLLGVRVRAIEHVGLPVLLPHRRRGGTGVQPLT